MKVTLIFLSIGFLKSEKLNLDENFLEKSKVSIDFSPRTDKFVRHRDRHATPLKFTISIFINIWPNFHKKLRKFILKVEEQQNFH